MSTLLSRVWCVVCGGLPPSTMSPAGVRLLAAAKAGESAECAALLESGQVEPSYQEEEHGHSSLMLAAGAGHQQIVSLLLEAGAPWNALDRSGRCAGNHALEAGHQEIVDLLVEHATRCELLLGASERRLRESNTDGDEYLQRSIIHEGERADGEALLDEAGDAVMMKWETPVMELHAAQMCEAGGDVMNVGFGLGIIDTAISERKPRSHTIIEAHPQVHERMIAGGWCDRPGVSVKLGRWQDVLPTLSDASFDAIFFDTYAEDDAEMAAFHQQLPRLLRPGGIYSFFNGFCPRNIFFQGVACAVVQLELEALGFSCEFRSVTLPRGAVNGEGWEGVRRPYFYSETYYLPHCVLGGAGKRTSARAEMQEDAEVAEMGTARRFIDLNESLMVLLATSLAPAAEALNGAADNCTPDSSGLRALIAEQILPHLEEAGWHLTRVLNDVWAASESGRAITPLQTTIDGLDDNSAEVLRRIVEIYEGDPAASFTGELRLAILRNPLTVDDEQPVVNRDGVDYDGPASTNGGTCRDIDGNETWYTSAQDFWEAIGRSDPAMRPELPADGNGRKSPTATVASQKPQAGSGWYASSLSYWGAKAATVPSMLGGLERVHSADVTASLQFIDDLHADAQRPVSFNGVALDCGAGIGRVSRSVLLRRFELVDLVEPVAAFLEQARVELPAKRVRRSSAVGLQDWQPEQHVDTYSMVWVQWVLLYLTDDDTISFLRRAASSLSRNGYIVVKESVAKAGRGWYADVADGSLTRTHAHFEALFEQAGLVVARSTPQGELPKEIYAVTMYALVPAT